TMLRMNSSTRLALIDGITVDQAGPGELATGFTNIAILRGHLDAKEAQFARRQQVLADTQGAAPAVDAMNRTGRTSRHAAQKAAARADALGDAPRMTELLEKGEVSADHADALASEIAKLDEDQRASLLDLDDELASHAAGSTPEQFRRHLKKTIQQQSDDDGIEESERQRDQARITLGKNDETGMGEIRGELHPDDWQKVNRCIDAEVRSLRTHPDLNSKDQAQLSALALVNLVTGAQSTSRTPASVSVNISLPALLDECGADKFGEYSDGTPVPAETVRRHACDAHIIPVVLDGDGMPLDVGRAQRLATSEQRTALRTMYRTCAVDGCNTNFDRCEIHHLLEWTAHQGPTDLEYLLPLCGYHHHRAHEGLWRLQLDPDTRGLTVTYPDGTLHSTAWPDVLQEQHTTTPTPPTEAEPPPPEQEQPPPNPAEAA
ncbi:MAG: DUF222 domain-containing protein, partial [Ilumatobacter sp.]|uniref:HNH endonuclease signature motif containing protein n=1 Tax=Ilumatobacter sp. TaxID=1967498 RepID=UPI003C7917DD